jgi:hemolysin-activating ACP:hemolysin acyltransferase
MTRSGAAARHAGEQPVGVARWALADGFVAKRIGSNDRRLSAVEWKSGTNMRIIELVAPFGGEGEMREQVAALRPSAGCCNWGRGAVRRREIRAVNHPPFIERNNVAFPPSLRACRS